MVVSLASPVGKNRQGGLHEPETGRRQTLCPRCHRTFVDPRSLACPPSHFSRQRLLRVIAWRGRRPCVHPVRLLHQTNRARGHHHFDSNQRRKACPTVQLLNRRSGKLKRGQKI